MSNVKKDSNPIWFLAAVLFVIIIGVVILNFSSVFTSDKEDVTEAVVLGSESNKEYSITVYYFPERKSEAQALVYYFKEYGYPVTLKSALTVPALKGSKDSPSHIFFNREDIGKAMELKLRIEGVIGHAVNAYRFHVPQYDPAMMMVFTGHGA